MKKDLTIQFNLPSYVKGKSFAEASKAIEAKFKGRNDKASIETKQELLERLSQAQEFIKQQGEGFASNNTFNGGGRPTVQGVNELIPNGITNLTTNSNIEGISGPLNLEGQSVASAGTGAAGIVDAASTALELSNMAFGKTGIDTTGSTKAPEVKVGNMATNGALKGAKAGMAFGPWGAAVGGVLGGVSGLIGGNKAKKDAIEASRNYDWAQNSKHITTFDLGGYTDPNKSKAIHLPNKENPKEQEEALLHYQNQKKLTDTQVEGFLNQRASDREWEQNKNKYIEDSFREWRQGKTGNSPNNKFTQVSAEYQNALNNIKDVWYKENPRQINEIVTEYANSKAMGGYQNKYDGLTRKSSYINTDPTITQNPEGINIDANKLGLNPAGFEAYQAANAGNVYVEPKTQTGEILSKTGDFLKDNYGSILRYAPIVGNLTDKLKKPITERGTRLDNVYQPQLFDEQSLLNQINQNNVNRAITESSGGDLGALRTNLLASNLNKTKAISDAYMKGEQINRDEKRFQFQNALQKDTFNAQQDERYIERKAQDEGAYNTAKSAQRAAIFEDIGKIGKEETYKKMVKDMFGYTWNGKYFVDKNGNKVDKAIVDAKVSETKTDKK